MLMKIKGVGFDLDGTLVNSLPGLANAVDATLRSAGLPTAGEERVAHWIGNGATVLIQRALSWAGKTPTDADMTQLRQTFDNYYAQTIETGSQLYPNVLTTLDILHQHAIPMALITNKPSPFVAPLLEQLGINHYFSMLIGADDVVVKKPHPAPIYLVLGQLGLRAEEFLFVGDSRNDIEAAKAAHCPTAAMTYGYNYGEPIALSQPDYVLDHFADILPIIGFTKTDNTGIKDE